MRPTEMRNCSRCQPACKFVGAGILLGIGFFCVLKVVGTLIGLGLQIDAKWLCRTRPVVTTSKPNVIRPLRHRFGIGYYLEELGFRTGAEVGVQMAAFSYRLLSTWPSCEKIYLIDVWASVGNYKDFADASNDTNNLYMQKAVERMKPFADKAIFMKSRSDEASKLIENDSLDFVYLDARHDYCAVANDMRLWWPKVRSGGILAGHDYMTHEDTGPTQDWTLCEDGRREPGAVKRAVDEFAMSLGVQVSVTYKERVSQSWLLRKP